MKELFLAYLFKLRHDITFKITLIIGLGLAVFLSLLYVGISFLSETLMISGASMYISSLSPTSNFGLAVPINLVTFTVMEFSQGGIRNKIIGGHSKKQIYASIFLNGLVFTFALMIVYSLLCLGLGAGFGALIKQLNPDWESLGTIDLTSLSMTSGYADYYFLRITILAILCYVSIVSFTVFFATLFRNIGPCIPVILISLIFLSLASTIIILVGHDNETALWVGRIVDPLFCLNAGETAVIGYKTMYGEEMAIYGSTISNEVFISGICSNLFYAALFFTGGILIFSKRDIK